jgi:hypothetical protein
LHHFSQPNIVKNVSHNGFVIASLFTTQHCESQWLCHRITFHNSTL